jgi:hypothetical protein
MENFLPHSTFSFAAILTGDLNIATVPCHLKWSAALVIEVGTKYRGPSSPCRPTKIAA